jgi:flagellar biosynthetic protein FliR
MTPEDVLARFGEQQVTAFFLVLARISPLFVLAPLFSSKLIPLRGRVVVALGLAVGITPIAFRGPEIPLEPWTLAGLMGKELLVGLAFAFILGALFHAVATAGGLLDTLIGFSLGSVIDPLTGSQSTVLAQLYSLVAILVFIAIQGDAWVIQGLARTYELVPLVDAPALGSLVEGVRAAFTGILAAAVQVCAPVLLAIVVTDVAIGIVSKVVPQLNVFAVGFPAKVIVGLLLIGASLPFTATWLADELQQSVGTALDALRVA